MNVAEVTIHMQVPAQRIWQLLADFKNVSLFHPLVKKSPLLSDFDTGLGAERRCEFHDGSFGVERVIHWEEGRSLAVEVVSGTLPLIKMMKRGEVWLTVNPKGSHQCTVTARMDFTLKGGIAGQLLGAMLVAPMTRRLFKNILCALQHHALTGERIGKGVPKGAMANCRFLEAHTAP